MSRYFGPSDTPCAFDPDNGFHPVFEMPADEVIDASWEKVKARLDRMRHTAQKHTISRSNSALEQLDDSRIIRLYLDAIKAGTIEDFLVLIEEIIRKRRLMLPVFNQSAMNK